MNKNRLKGAIAGAAILVAGFTGLAISGASAETAPVCENVSVQENSGNGPNYTIKLCGPSALPVKSIVIDGGPLPEKTEHTWAPVAMWGK